MELNEEVDKMKVGFFLAYAPEQPISNQGIGRLMSFVISGMLQHDDLEITIACPAWYEEIVIDFLKSQNIDINKINLITTSAIPILLRIRNLIYTTSSKKENFTIIKSNVINIKFFFKETLKFKFLKKGLKKTAVFIPGLLRFKKFLSVQKGKIKEEKLSFMRSIVFKTFFKWISMSSVPGFILSSLFIIPLAILSIPFLLLQLGFRLFQTGFFKLQGFLPEKYKSYLIKPLKDLRRNLFAHKIYEEVYSQEVKRLIFLINKRPDIEVWFIPTLFWPEVVDINAKKIVAAPDVVLIDFNTHFVGKYWYKIYKKIAKTIKAADHLICYNEHVKQKQLIDHFDVSPKKISVIKHGITELSDFLNDGKSTINKRYNALNILLEYQSKFLVTDPYLNNFDLSNIKYIIYTSQVRPHKNYLSLIKAFEILLRKRFINIKLIITGNLNNDKELMELVLNRRLQYDILSFNEVSSEILAALNNLALCSVNPTLFEGGFPFTFSEAYSVGTPSVMSNIPLVSNEIEDKALHQYMLFDPLDEENIADKIEWAINNKKELYKLQAPLYEKFKQRPWQVVAKEYIDLFHKVGGTSTRST